MATIAAQTIGDTGATIVLTPVNASDTLTNDGNSYLRVVNENAADCLVTIAAVRPCSQGFAHDMEVTVPATTGDKNIGPFPPNRFGAAPVVTYSVTSDVSAALVTLNG